MPVHCSGKQYLYVTMLCLIQASLKRQSRTKAGNDSAYKTCRDTRDPWRITSQHMGLNIYNYIQIWVPSWIFERQCGLVLILEKEDLSVRCWAVISYVTVRQSLNLPEIELPPLWHGRAGVSHLEVSVSSCKLKQYLSDVCHLGHVVKSLAYNCRTLSSFWTWMLMST